MATNVNSATFGSVVRLLVDTSNVPDYINFNGQREIVGTKSVCLCLSQDAYDLLKALILIPFMEQFYHFPSVDNWKELYGKFMAGCNEKNRQFQTETDTKSKTGTSAQSDSNFALQFIESVVSGQTDPNKVLDLIKLVAPKWVDALTPPTISIVTEVIEGDAFAASVVPLLAAAV